MPQAVVSTEALHYELESCPGGFVDIRRMSYGKYLVRQEMALRLKVQSQQTTNQFEGEMAMANKAVTVFEFKECVVDHNLTDLQDQPLNFASPVTIEILDPRIGDEIGSLINKLHQFDAGKSSTASGGSSSDAGSLIAMPMQPISSDSPTPADPSIVSPV